MADQAVFCLGICEFAGAVWSVIRGDRFIKTLPCFFGAGKASELKLGGLKLYLDLGCEGK